MRKAEDFKINIWHAPVDLDGDITPFVVSSIEVAQAYLLGICASHENDDDNTVVLMALEDLIFVQDTTQDTINRCCYLILDDIESCIEMYVENDDLDSIDVHIQEFKSYEEAYKVALLMRENNPLCYEE